MISRESLFVVLETRVFTVLVIIFIVNSLWLFIFVKTLSEYKAYNLLHQKRVLLKEDSLVALE